MYSASEVDRATMACFLLNQLIAPPAITNRFPVVECQLSESPADPCVYIRVGDTITVVAVYVDDLILIAGIQGEMRDVKKNLADRFK